MIEKPNCPELRSTESNHIDPERERLAEKVSLKTGMKEPTKLSEPQSDNELGFICIACDNSFPKRQVDEIKLNKSIRFICKSCSRPKDSDPDLETQLLRARHDSESNLAAFREVSKQLRRAINAVRKLAHAHGSCKCAGRVRAIAFCPFCESFLIEGDHADDCETKLLEAITDKTEKNDQRSDKNESNDQRSEIVRVFRCPKCNKMIRKEYKYTNANCLKCDTKMEDTWIEREVFEAPAPESKITEHVLDPTQRQRK